MAPPLSRARRRRGWTHASALVSLLALLLLAGAARRLMRSGSFGVKGQGIGATAAEAVSASMVSPSSSTTSSSSSSLAAPPPPLLLRSGTVDVRPGRGLVATRLSHSVGRRLLSEASSSSSSPDVVTIAATTDARWGPLRSGSAWSPRALASRLLSLQQRRSSSSSLSPSSSFSSSWASSSSTPRQLVVAFSSSPPPHGAAEALSRVLHRFGGSLGSFLPEASFVAVGNSKAAAAVLRLVPGVAAVGELPPESKLAPELIGDVLLPGEDREDEEEGEEKEELKTTTLAVVFPRLGRAAGGLGGDSASRLLPRCGDEGYDPSSAAAVDWAEPLSLLAGGRRSSVRVAGRQGRHVLLVEVVEEKVKASSSSSSSTSSPSSSLASRVTRWLAAQPATHWLSPASLEASTMNWQASAIIQSGKGAPSASGNAVADAATHPLWAADVTGRGQVIGGGDSGLDLSHCFFADPDVPIELKSVGSSGNSGGWRGFFGGGNGGGGGGSVFESEKHRKIRLYRSTSNASPNGGGGNGHGTHTMGSLCGSPFDSGANAKATAYRGMAPDAKLAFSDLSSEKANSGSKSGRSSGAILVPGDMGGDYYRFAYDAGARVHSDSWGSASLEYDYMASEVDAFTFKRQDFVPVLAAGNEGSASASPNRGVTTVTAPATAKNCIAVGASQSAYAHGAVSPGSAFSLHKLTVSQQQRKSSSGGDESSAAADVSSSSPSSSSPPTEVESFRVVQAQFGGRLSSLYGKRLALAAASPPDACGNLDNAASVSGAALIAARGGCTFADKASAAQAAGAVALLVYDDRISDFFIPAASNGNGNSNDAGKDLMIPAAALPRRVGQLLASAAAASSGSDGGGGAKSTSSSSSSSSSSPTRITVSFGPPPSAGDPWDSLADFSSKGPTPDGRIKPDLVAPGVLQSAAAASTVGEGGGENEGFFGRGASSSSAANNNNNNNFKCPLRTMQGTSMATPVVAGAAALVRSYFSQGFYPDGTPDPSRSFEPGGALVKAVLAAGAAPLDGFESDTGLPLAPPPSYRMGFGRVHLARSLPLAAGSGSSKKGSSSTTTGWALQVVDRAPISGGETHRFCLRSTGGPLTVVLAWHDAPGAPSSGRALVNDLDLVVRAAGLGGLPLVGNGGGGGGGGKGENRDVSSNPNSVPPADRLNNVESVAVAYLPPGDVSIEVRGSSVPRGPQPYALAALGEFSGVLASAHNPFVNAQAAAAASGAAGGRCDVVVATVRKGPEGVVARRDVEFEFGTAAGGGAGSFECALVSGDGNEKSSSSSNWKPCKSPVSFKALEDGRHVFKVRAQGEASAASRGFEVDATPPSLWWREKGDGGNLPSSSSLSSSSSPFLPSAATISFGADDASAVSFRCRLELVAEGQGARPLPAGAPAGMIRLWTAAEAVPAAVSGLSLATTSTAKTTKISSPPPRPPRLSTAASVPGIARARPIKLGEWNPNCTSPASFAWLPPGRWRASVDARDAAGNAAPKPLSHEWIVSQPSSPPSSRSPFIVAGPYGPSNASSAEFELRALTGDGRLEAVAASDAPQCQLLPLESSSSSSSSPPGAPVEGRQPAPVADSAEEKAWTSCGSKVGLASYGKLEDGGYQFAVRFGGSGSGGGGRKRRRSLSAANSTTAATTKATASSSSSASSSAPSAFSVFGVDTIPPNVTITGPPPAVLPTGALEVAFSAQEPAAFTCLLASTTTTAAALAATTAKDNKKKPAASPPPPPPLSITTFPCVSPANYSSLPDGSYQFSVVATDGVGNTSPLPPPTTATATKSPTSSSPSTFSFIVDTLPPVVPAPTLDPPVASKAGNFAATFSGVSDVGSGVAKTQCRLRLLAAPGEDDDSKTKNAEGGAFEDCSSPFVASNLSRGRWGLTVRAVDAAGNAAESAEASFYVDDSPPRGAAVTSSPPKDKPSPSKVTFAFAAPPDAASAPVTKWECSLAKEAAGEEKKGEKGVSNAAAPRGGGAAGAGGEGSSLSEPRSWQKCSSPMVFKNLKSGNYSFVARATDAAGNVGPPTKASTFAVDASLPLPRDNDTGGDNGGSSFFSAVSDWFSSLQGWRLWAVIGGGVALAVLLATVVCCCCCSSSSSSSAAARYRQQHHPRQQQQDPDAAALAAALAASARERDAAAVAAARREREALERAVQASREEELVRRALERSMVEK